MKRKLFFFSLLCSMMVACTTEKETVKGNPIENLMSYLDEQDVELTHAKIIYQGGDVLETSMKFWINAATPKAIEKLKKDPEIDEKRIKEVEEANTRKRQVIDSCLNAFRWGCSVASHCYHKENHVLDKDTVIYALALEPLEGEKIELQGEDSYEGLGIKYQAARATTLHYTGDKEYADITIDYVNREAKGKMEPFDDRPLKDFIKWVTEEIDSVKVYETSYEYTHEDYQGNPPLVAGFPDENWSFDGKTTGHLYAVPASHAKEVFDALKFRAKNDYVDLNPNQHFSITIDDDMIVVCEPIEFGTASSTEPTYHKGIYGKLSVDGHFYMLVMDQSIGALGEPIDWHHVLRIKDHKVEYIPNAHKPNKDGWID